VDDIESAGAVASGWRKAAVPSVLVFILGCLWLSTYNPIRGLTPGVDSGMYLYAAQRLLRGATLYRDVFDNKGPLLYVINATGLALGSGSAWGVVALEYLLLSLGLVLGWLTVRRHMGIVAAGFALLFWILLVNRLGFDNREEFYFFPLCFGTLFLLMRKPSEATGIGAWVAAGVLLSCALFLKPTGIGLWLALVIVELLTSLRSRSWAHFGQRVLALAWGAAVGSAVFLIWLAATGALAAFWDAYVTFNMAYSRLWGLGARLSSPIYGAGQVGIVTAAAIAVVWVLAVRRLLAERHSSHLDRLALLAVVWLPVEVVLASTSGWHRVQYYLTWAIPAALLLGGAVSRLLTDVSARRSAGRKATRSLVLLGVVVIAACATTLPATLAAAKSLGGSFVRYERYVRLRPSAQYAGVARYIDETTSPSDTVLLWGGYSAQVNFLADRASPTRYVMQLALYRSQYGAERVWTFLRDLEAHPPALIIDTSPTFGPQSGYFPVPPLGGGAEFWRGQPEAFVEAWSAVFDYIHRNYQVDRTLPFFPNWTTYVRSGQSLR